MMRKNIKKIREIIRTDYLRDTSVLIYLLELRLKTENMLIGNYIHL